MESRVYDVEVTYRQRVIYRVEGEDRESAERLAAERWQRGERGELHGFEWSELEGVVAAEAADPQQQRQDEELVLRFLQERERLILRLGGDLLGSNLNDAISASQVAQDLGWRRGSAGGTVPDVPRATQALERLCEKRRAVVFERSRVRAGERGEIRLYCTPEYLERLSNVTLEPVPQHAG